MSGFSGDFEGNIQSAVRSAAQKARAATENQQQPELVQPDQQFQPGGPPTESAKPDVAVSIQGLDAALRGQPQGRALTEWQPTYNTEQAKTFLGTNLDFETIGESGVRIANRIGPENFVRAWQLSSGLQLGGREELLSKSDRDLLQKYRAARLDDAVREFDASTYAAEHPIRNHLDLVVRDAAEFSDRLISTLPQLAYGVASLFGAQAPRAMNEAIGLDGIAAPRIGYYLGAALAKLNGSERPLSEEYARIARGEEMRMGASYLPWYARPSMNAAGVAGDLTGIMGTGNLSLIGKAGGAVEKLVGLEKASKAISEWAVGAGGANWMRKVAGFVGKEALVPGLRFGAWEGVANYVNPETGELKDGWERATSGITALAFMPVYAAFGLLGSKAAGALTGESRAIRNAFAAWLNKLPEEGKAAVTAAGQRGMAAAYNNFVKEMMPGVSATPWFKRELGNAVASVVESIGFTPTDAGFWHDLKDAIQDKPGAVGKVGTRFFENVLAMGMLRFGSSRVALSVREIERVMEALQRPEKPAEQKPSQETQAQPAAPEAAQAAPEQAPAAEPQPQPEQPQGKPYDTQAEIDAAREWLTTQSDPQVEADFLINRAVQRAAEIPDTNRAEQERYLTYAARLMRWRQSGMEGPRGDFPGEKPADVATWEKELADLRSGVAEAVAQEQKAKTEDEHRQGIEQATKRAKQGKAADEAAQAKEVTREASRAEAQQSDELRGLRARRDAELAEAKLALDGIGGPTAEEAVKLVYDRKNPPRLVTYQGGKYWTRPVFGDAAWKEMPAKEALNLAKRKQPREAIPEQLAVVDQIMKRVLEVAGDLSESQQKLWGQASLLAAVVDRKTDPGVNAALSMAEQVNPETWTPRHIDVFSQMALRGFSPEAQQIMQQEFLNEPQGQLGAPTDHLGLSPYEGQDGKRLAVQRAETNAKKRPPEPNLQPKAKEPGSPETSAPKAPTAESKGKEVPLSAADDEMLRTLAEGAGIPTEGLSRKELERELAASGITSLEVASENPESGKVSLRTAAAATVLFGAAEELVRLGVVSSPLGWTIGSLMFAVPILWKHWASRTSERLPFTGDKVAGQRLVPIFQKERDRAEENRRRFEPAVQAVKEAAGENWLTKTGRRFRKAVQALQQVRYDDPNAATTAGDDLTHLYGDGHDKDMSKLSKQQVELLDMLQKVLNVGADLIEEKGQWMLNQRTGEYFRTKFSRERRIMPSMFTPDGMDSFLVPGTKAWNAIRDGIQKRTGIELAEVEKRMRIVSQSEAFRRGSFEMTRILPWIPSHIRVDGVDIAILETRPYEYAQRYADMTSARLGWTETWGQEAAKQNEGITEAAGLGVDLVNPTEEQKANRAAMQDYIKKSPDQDRAIRALVAVARAHHGLPLDKPYKLPADLLNTAPGNLSYRVLRDYMNPAYALWRSFKLTTAFIPNIIEPVGTASTVFGWGTMFKAHATLMFDLATGKWDKVQREIRSLAEDVGGAADQPALRLGGFSVERRPAHRASDIVKLIELLSAPMKMVNALNDVALARAGKIAIAEWKAKQMSASDRAWWADSLRLLDFSPKERKELLDGDASPELERSFLRRLRKDIYGVRGRADQGYLQQLRMSRALFAFQGWSSANMRMWGKMVGHFAEALDPTSGLDAASRARRATRFFRFLLGKGISHAVSMMGYALAFNGAQMWRQFQGNDDSETAKTFFQKLGIYAIAQELGGPLIGAIMAKAQGYQPSVVDAMAQASPLTNMGSEFIQMAQGTGAYEKARPGIRGIWDRGVTFLLSLIPVARAADSIAHDPGLRTAIRRFYEVFPSTEGKSTETEHNEFRGAMAAAMDIVRRSGRNFKTVVGDDMRDALKRAMLAPPVNTKQHPHAVEEWERLSEGAKMAQGKAHVLRSIESRKLWSSLSSEGQNVYLKKAGKENVKALMIYDAMLDELASFAKMAF